MSEDSRVRARVDEKAARCEDPVDLVKGIDHALL
jgi:hypothetical protein